MYNNISQDLATGACKDFLEDRIEDKNEYFASTNSILTALSLCVKNNFFTLHNKIYKQICGVRTGIKLAPIN